MVKIGILGVGTVGSSVAKILEENNLNEIIEKSLEKVESFEIKLKSN